MFLSEAITGLEADGSLIVDLRDRKETLVRFGPFAGGMPWHCLSRDGWVETTTDFGVRLVNRAHDAQKNLPVQRYLRDWPAQIIEALYSVWDHQSRVMRLCAVHPTARDLLRGNPVLLWLLATASAGKPGCGDEASRLLALPQRALLAHLLGQDAVRTAQVRFLRKLVVMEGTGAMLFQIRDCVADENTVMALRHWPRLPTPLLPLVKGPLLLHLHWLREEFASTSNRWMLGQILERYLPLVRDTSRMVEQLGYDATDPALKRFTRTPGGLQQLHDVLVRALNQPDANPAGCLADAERFLGPPPIPPNETFQAITTVGELYAEGREMRHCVASRADDVLAGACYVYRMNLNGERATLQIGIHPSGWVIDEFRLRGNADPSEEAWAAAVEWIRNANGPSPR
jgi:hypothetical protein